MRSYPISIHGTFLLLVLLCSFLPFSTISAQTDTGLPAGCHRATAADVAAGGSSVILGVSNICPNDVRAGINGDVGAAKTYLDSLPKRPLSQCAPPTTANITRLNNGFAVCAAAFFKAYTAKYGNVYITSAFRDNTPGSAPDGVHSANQCAGGAPKSRHALGYAIDVNPASESLYPTMWKFASDNPQFGVCFPYQNHPLKGYPNGDRPHMILAGIGGGEGALCASQGVTKACAAGANFAPTYPGTGGTPSTPGGGGSTSAPQAPLPPITRGGVTGCLNGYILFNNQCFPNPEETVLGPDGQACPLDARICPDGSYVGRTGPNCSFIACPISAQSYCQVGYVFVNNQCAPTYCNGSSQYAVTNLNPIQIISCNQQQQTQCPQGYIMMNNQCTPFNQNQPSTQGQTPPTGGTQPGTSSGGSTPAGGQSTTGLGTSGQNTTSTSAPQCTPQYGCQNGVVYFQTSFCTVQTYQTCQYGCSTDGTTCALTSTSTASTSTQPSASFIDRLNSLIHPASPTSNTPSGGSVVGIILDSMSSGQTAISLNQDIRNATGQTAGTTVGSTAFPSISSIYGGPNPLIVTQTFTSSDQPVQTNTSPSYSSEKPTFFQSALLDLKTTLLSVLAYLHLIQQRP